MDNKNVSNMGSSSQTNPNESNTNNRNFNSFLTILSVQLAHRFPNSNELNNIDNNTIRSISELCLNTANIAINLWDDNEKNPISLKKTA